ncbi:NAD(P)H-dependent oxidoreductase [Phenylobacterium kunshanense]|uniref:Flavodoxin family protein n=1 Tax=Phenylobacterium kunshanense TaxID=1445034 RepID=A0A328B703_9CAUL|nr:NAD(P)H-dependent oxidoreductase [Phenylobacterium kunshanense]RAK62873.1 flavodoxin family protein [Phenylobacterium kunshanense]
MKHAVVLAHPAAGSLNAAIARAYAETVQARGHAVVVRDLYALGFDPCLKAEEIPGPGEPRFGPDVVAERAELADAEVFVFVYPIWFNGPPAILKGYVDRVFGMGFGFRPAFGGTEPALSGRRLISFTTSGAPDAWMNQTGALEGLRRLFDAHLAGTTGLTVADHVHFGGMVSGITEEAFEEVIEAVRRKAGEAG